MHRGVIDTLLEVRRRCAWGEQWDYFDHHSTVGFVRSGDAERPGSGLALLITNGADGDKWMHVGENHAGEEWVEATGCCPGVSIRIDEAGNGHFIVPAGKMALWIPQNKEDTCDNDH